MHYLFHSSCFPIFKLNVQKKCDKAKIAKFYTFKVSLFQSTKRCNFPSSRCVLLKKQFYLSFLSLAFLGRIVAQTQVNQKMINLHWIQSMKVTNGWRISIQKWLNLSKTKWGLFVYICSDLCILMRTDWTESYFCLNIYNCESLVKHMLFKRMLNVELAKYLAKRRFWDTWRKLTLSKCLSIFSLFLLLLNSNLVDKNVKKQHWRSEFLLNRQFKIHSATLLFSASLPVVV